MAIIQAWENAAAGVFAALVGNELDKAYQGKQEVEDIDYKVIASLAWEVATAFIGERPNIEELKDLLPMPVAELKEKIKNMGTFSTGPKP